MYPLLEGGERDISKTTVEEKKKKKNELSSETTAEAIRRLF